MKADNKNPGMMLFITFLILFLVNSVVIYLANALFPQLVVLGTISITPLWAIIHSVGVLALIDTFVLPFVRRYENQKGKMLTNRQWMIVYFLVNLVGVWAVARFSDQFGLGIKSWVVAAVLAVMLDFVQGLAMMKLEKFRSKFS